MKMDLRDLGCPGEIKDGEEERGGETDLEGK